MFNRETIGNNIGEFLDNLPQEIHTEILNQTIITLPRSELYYQIILLAFDTRCNLDCSYCFDKTLSYHNKNSTFKEEDIKLILDKTFLEYNEVQDFEGIFISISSGEFFLNKEKVQYFKRLMTYMNNKTDKEILLKIFSNFSAEVDTMVEVSDFMETLDYTDHVMDFTFHLEQLSLDFYMKKLKELTEKYPNHKDRFMFILLTDTYTEEEFYTLRNYLKENNYNFVYSFNVWNPIPLPKWIGIPEEENTKYIKYEMNIENYFVNYNYQKKFYSARSIKFRKAYNIFDTNINEYDRCFKDKRLKTRKRV